VVVPEDRFISPRCSSEIPARPLFGSIALLILLLPARLRDVRHNLRSRLRPLFVNSSSPSGTPEQPKWPLEAREIRAAQFVDYRRRAPFEPASLTPSRRVIIAFRCVTVVRPVALIANETNDETETPARGSAPPSQHLPLQARSPVPRFRPISTSSGVDLHFGLRHFSRKRRTTVGFRASAIYGPP